VGYPGSREITFMQTLWVKGKRLVSHTFRNMDFKTLFSGSYPIKQFSQFLKD
jgi:hypothetical protein